MNHLSKILLLVWVIAVWFSTSVTFANTSNLCPFDDDIIYKNFELSESDKKKVRQCYEIDHQARRLVDSFNMILYNWIEYKRDMVIDWLSTNAPKLSKERKYLYFTIANRLRFSGYSINSLKTCEDFSFQLSDIEAPFAQRIIFKKWKNDTCAVTTKKTLWNAYAEEYCTFTISEMNERYNNNIDKYHAFKWDMVENRLEYLNNIDNRKSRCVIKNTNDDYIEYNQKEIKEFDIQEINKVRWHMHEYIGYVNIYSLINTGVLPKSFNTDINKHIDPLPENIYTSSICKKSNYEELYFVNSKEKQYALLFPTISVKEFNLEQDDLPKFLNDKDVWHSYLPWIWDPTIFFNDCKSIKREMFDRKADGTYKYEDYSCAKDITKCKPSDYLVVIGQSND